MVRILCGLTILLSAFVFTACGEKDEPGGGSGGKSAKSSDDDPVVDVGRPLVNTKDYTKEKGGEDLLNGKADYDIMHYDTAATYFSRAVQQGNPEAMFWLGKCFLDGTGVPEDAEKAVSYFRNAEEAGYFIDAQTQYDVGKCFFSGDGVSQDAAEAVKWFRKAATQGHAEAQIALAECCFAGGGVAQDYAEAVKWFRKAGERLKTAELFMNAHNGKAEAQFKLAQAYEKGDGVKKDYTEAVKWYRKAAEQGHAGAKETLGPVNLSGGAAEVTVRVPGGVSMELVRVEAGSFTMSARDGDNFSSEVLHRATLTKAFYLGRTEVTQAQWRAVMGTNPSNFKGDDLPVEQVSWNDAMEFCEKLNDSGKAPKGWKFSLPTETQWEYAARGGKKSKGYKYSGSNTLDEVGWYDDNSGSKTHPVGKKKANELGLYDMSGNVYEWCLDDWQDKSDKLTAEFTRGNDRSGSKRASRGGGWGSIARFSLSAFRYFRGPGSRGSGFGFRIALVPESY